MSYITATARLSSGREGPVYHALHHSMPVASTITWSYAAACGAEVRAASHATFDPHHRRACSRCVRRLARAAS